MPQIRKEIINDNFILAFFVNVHKIKYIIILNPMIINNIILTRISNTFYKYIYLLPQIFYCHVIW